jgi:hypothetical protein
VRWQEVERTQGRVEVSRDHLNPLGYTEGPTRNHFAWFLRDLEALRAE